MIVFSTFSKNPEVYSEAYKTSKMERQVSEYVTVVRQTEYIIQRNIM